MTTAVVTQIAYAVQTLFDPAGTVGRLVDLGKLANYGLLTSFTPAYLFTAGINGTWYDPSDINLTWRRNLLTETEFRNGLVDAPIRGGLISATTLNGYQAAIAFSRDGVTSSYAYKSIYIAPLTTYSISAVVEMSDGLPPTFGSGTVASSTNDFIFVIGGETFSPITYVVQNIGNALYRVSATFTTPSSPSSANAGIIKYDSNSTRTFKVTAYQLEQGSTATPYQRITDGIQDYLQYQALPVLYQDAAGTLPVTAVEQPVGLMLDKSKGLVLGPELVTNGDFSSDTAWTKATGVTISGGKANFASVNVLDALYQNVGVVAGKRYKITASITGTGTVSPVFGGGDENVTNRRGAGDITWILNAPTGANGNFVFYAQSFNGTIDNISVRELPGNHAFNPSGNSANFPVLSARVNLLTKSEDFGDAVWAKGASVVVSPTKVTAPDGTQTATVISSSSSDLSANRVSQFPSTGTGNHVAVLWMRSNTAQVVRLKLYGSSGGVVVATLDVSVSEVWTQFNISGTISTANAGISVGPNGISALVNVELWGADLRVANDGVNLPAYQRVNTATDYDTVGFPKYLKFNGVNQWLQTNSIDFTYGDKMFVCAGVRKLSEAATGILAELSQNLNISNGSFYLLAPVNTNNQNFAFVNNGTAQAQTTAAPYPAPTTNVLTSIGNISGDQAILRVNGAQAAISTADQGTGNYGNYPLYIGARAGSSLWLNGNLYQLVIAGKQASASEITATESFINQKTGAY